MEVLAKTAINRSLFSYPRLSLLFDVISYGTNHPYRHFYYTFRFDRDDLFLFDLMAYDYSVIFGETKCFITLNLEQILICLSEELKDDHHKNFDLMVDLISKDGLQELLPSLYKEKGAWYVKVSK